MRYETDIVAIRTARTLIKRNHGTQVFYETPKAYELWQKNPLRRLKRWSKSRVLGVFT